MTVPSFRPVSTYRYAATHLVAPFKARAIDLYQSSEGRMIADMTRARDWY